MNNCSSCSGVGFIYLSTQYAGVDHHTLKPVYCDTLERCEACDGTGTVETPVSSQDWKAFDAMRLEAEREDFMEACAGLDSWAYGAQAA